MRLVSGLALSVWAVDAFVAPGQQAPQRLLKSLKGAQKDLSEFDFLLNENGQTFEAQAPRTRRVVNRNSNVMKTKLVSSITAPSGYEGEEEFDMEDSDEQEARVASSEGADVVSDDMYENFEDSKLTEYMEKPNSLQQFGSWLKNTDPQQVAWTFLIPGLFVAYFGRKAATRVIGSVGGSMETGLSSFANEMIFHDGDYEEMQLCKQEWDRRLFWLGPNKKNKMIKAYLEDYAKRKSISPVGIRCVILLLLLLHSLVTSFTNTHNTFTQLPRLCVLSV